MPCLDSLSVLRQLKSMDHTNQASNQLILNLHNITFVFLSISHILAPNQTHENFNKINFYHPLSTYFTYLRTQTKQMSISTKKPFAIKHQNMPCLDSPSTLNQLISMDLIDQTSNQLILNLHYITCLSFYFSSRYITQKKCYTYIFHTLLFPFP